MNAYLQHGIAGGPYRTESVPVKQTELVPNSGHTQSGYGGQIPTSYMVQWLGRWRRVYCMIYSNSGTLYIRSRQTTENRGKIIVRIDS